MASAIISLSSSSPRGRASAPNPKIAKAAGHYFYSHGLQALALETAEACAEWLHRRIREDWGFPDPPHDDHAATVSRRAIAANATASVILHARILMIRPASGRCFTPKTSASILPKA